jgi:hypothetical protein
MISVFYIILFIGIIMVIDGIYREQLNTLKNKKQIEYKFIPRSMYEENLYAKTNFGNESYMNLFNSEMDNRGSGRFV